jgi:uncharacterized membrane protein YbaN (DUF454 family)
MKSDARNLVAEVEAMKEKNSENDLMPMLFKGACLILVGLLTLVGLVGLILPIIPGILFLFLAALLLAKVSSRFDALLHKNENMRTWRRRWDTSNALPLLQRVKLSCLLVARAVVNGVEATVNSLKNVNSSS